MRSSASVQSFVAKLHISSTSPAEVTRGIGEAGLQTGVPVVFGVVTADTVDQAIDRAGVKLGNKGFEAATTAVELVNLYKKR